LTAKKESNRSEEQVHLEALESEVEVMKNWDRVIKLIDTGSTGSTGGTSKDSNASKEAEAALARGSDVSRMRKLFIQLKNDPLEVTRGGQALIEGAK
jgi:hypothetical protein